MARCKPDRQSDQKHGGPGDFPAWFAERRAARRKTLFIKGNHEDFVWLESQRDAEVLPGLFYLRNGATMELGAGSDVVRVGGLGGCYGPSDYERPSKHLQGYAKRHYTRDEIEALCKAAPVDVLLVHDAPAGVLFEQHRRGVDWVSQAAGLDELVAAVQPRVCFFGHYHRRVDAEIAGVRCIGLNLVRRPGNLVAIELDPTSLSWSIVGEWPARADRGSIRAVGG